MQIHRYLNGKPITRKELSRVELATDALKIAVSDARRRVAQETVMAAESSGELTVKHDGGGVPSDVPSLRTYG